jgi:hypothetical protein
VSCYFGDWGGVDWAYNVGNSAHGVLFKHFQEGRAVRNQFNSGFEENSEGLFCSSQTKERGNRRRRRGEKGKRPLGSLLSVFL